MFPSLDLHYLFLIVLYRNMVHLYKLFFQPLMINIEPALWSFRLPPEVIFLGILFLFFIIQILSTDHDHWLLNIIQINTCFSTFLIGATDLLGDRTIIFDDMIFCAWYYPAKLLTPDTGQAPNSTVKI